MKLTLQYFGHLIWRMESLEKTLMLGKTEAGREGDGRGWDGWMASPTQWTWVWVSSGSWCWTERPGMLQSVGSQWVGRDWTTEMSWTHVLILINPTLNSQFTLGSGGCGGWLLLALSLITFPQSLSAYLWSDWWLLDSRHCSFWAHRNLCLEGWNPWCLWHPCLPVWQEIFHFTQGVWDKMWKRCRLLILR